MDGWMAKYFSKLHHRDRPGSPRSSALAAQDTLKNFFGSLMIMLDKPFTIGQRVIFGGYDGVVEEIGFRSTRVRTLTGHQATIPNEKVASESVENIGRRPSGGASGITATYENL